MDVHPSKKLVVCGIENGSILFAVDGQTLTYLDEIRTTFTAEEYAEEEQQPEKEEEEKQTKKQSNKQPTVPPPTEYSENYQVGHGRGHVTLAGVLDDDSLYLHRNVYDSSVTSRS